MAIDKELSVRFAISFFFERIIFEWVASVSFVLDEYYYFYCIGIIKWLI